MSTPELIILSVILVSLVSLIGVSLIFVNERRFKSIIYFLVSVSAGALFGDSLLHLIPDSIEQAIEGGGGTSEVSIYIFSGILFFFIFEKILHWHHHHSENEEEDAKIHPVGPLVLLSDAIHNLIDGVVIAGSFFVSTELGIATTIAVMLHEIPHEIGNVSLLIHFGFSKAKAIIFNCISALSSVVGALFVILIFKSNTEFINILIPFTAGTFIYIAGSDLVPELHRDIGFRKTIVQVTGIVLGAGLMYALLYIE